MQDAGVGFLFPYFNAPTWNNIMKSSEKSGGVDLYANVPEKLLPLGPDTHRPLFLVGNEDDTTVPIHEFDMFTGLLNTLSSKYSVTEWRTSGSCHGEAHSVKHLVDSDRYLVRLCYFWAESF